MSDYAPCACRDCMDIAITDDNGEPTLCPLCDGAGCEPLPSEPFPGMLSMFDCQRADAYGQDS